MCKFRDPSIIGSRNTEGGGGPRSPPQSQIDQKKPSLNRVKGGFPDSGLSRVLLGQMYAHHDIVENMVEFRNKDS